MQHFFVKLLRDAVSAYPYFILTQTAPTSADLEMLWISVRIRNRFSRRTVGVQSVCRPAGVARDRTDGQTDGVADGLAR